MISSYMIEDEPILNDEYIEAIPLGHPFDYSVYFTAIVNDNRKNETSLLRFIDYLKVIINKTLFKVHKLFMVFYIQSANIIIESYITLRGVVNGQF